MWKKTTGPGKFQTLILFTLGAVILALAATTAPPARADCSLTSLGITPLNDLGTSTYSGFQGGLYPGGTSVRPSAHTAAGEQIAANIVPLNNAGIPDPANGKIVMISVGMSNTAAEFNTFVPLASNDPARNSQLVIVNGSQGGRAADSWIDPSSDTYDVLDSNLGKFGVSPAQVQIAWIKQAQKGEGNFPGKPLALQDNLEDIARALKTNYPNIQIAYFSSRTRSYKMDGLSPEPTAYETGFAVKWMIEKQINGDPSLNFDLSKGAVQAPWISWGPYLWADGTNPRSDGFVWLCSDLKTDFTHPSATGSQKVAEQLLAFFKTDTTARSWFLREADTGQSPICKISTSTLSGKPGATINFSSLSSDPDGEIVETAWTFDDGGYSYAAQPSKSFPAPGIYNVHLTATDNSGNPSTCDQKIFIDDSGTLPPTPTPTQPGSPTPTPWITPAPTNTPPTPIPTSTPPTPIPTLPAPIFGDVPFDHPYHLEIETVYNAGYTAGCQIEPLLFCPDESMNRAESAVFVERGIHGVDILPDDPSSQIFDDLPLDSWAAKWASALYADKFTSGCGVDPLIYCPWQGHTRLEGSVFYLRMLHGAEYQPPKPSGVFADLPLEHWGAKWAEAAFNAGLIDACPLKTFAPGVYFCPEGPLTRALAASMMVRAKNLLNP
jgi:hypothetical protein